MKNYRRSLFTSVVCLLLCFSMLLGTTFAWFSDIASSDNNVVTSGTLDAKMYWSDSLPTDNKGWKEVDNGQPIFTYDNWEPGYTDIKYIKVENAGDLAFKWRISIDAESALTELADVIDVYYVNPIAETLTSLDGRVSSGSLKTVVNSRIATSGVILPEGEPGGSHAVHETVLAIALHMDKDAGNKYQGASIGKGFSVNLVATQFDYENDTFGSGYDSGATYPELPGVAGASITVPVKRSANGTSAEPVVFSGAVNAVLPAGAKLAPGVEELTLILTDIADPEANIVLSENERARSYNVHITGLAADNDVPAVITISELLPVGLNMGNYDLYHVEHGMTNKMTLLTDGAASVHNGYTYDPATGDTVLHLATFSEIALVADTVNAWNGTTAEAFAGGSGTEEDPYLIANADQLAYLNEVISNENETYGDKHYKLVADINLGGEENTNKGIIFYPIGYHKVGGTIATVDVDDAPEFLYFEEDPDYARGSASVISDEGTTVNWYTYGGSLQGTFDGDGHTIANIYQNTWQMRGNYDGHYYKEAMGIFGYVNGGTVKNLTVDSFSSDGEFTPTGCVAAYARDAVFENIAITNCNPRVYNTGNGGIVGIGGHSTADTDEDKISFSNITIDNSNKITALWGSWDVACGGLIGMFRGAGHVNMTNCHVAAQIDVYNDVCGNYQYYWYRYSGMMIGTNKNMITDANGYTVPETEKFHAENCTVHFGSWNSYYYCELVANSLASYTHDHQFSRLTQVDSIDVEGLKYTVGGTEFDIPSSGRANYVIVNGAHATENATCYHFVNGEKWEHEDAGYETVNGETILKEDRQHYYLPFNQLFTGYGWGVKHIPVYNGEDYAFAGITILDRETANSVEKFEGKVTELNNNREYTLGEIFGFVDNGVKLIPGALTVTITNTDENRPVSVIFKRNSTDWENGKVQFTGTGEITITIQDYYFCTPTTITVNVTERQPEEKFDVVMKNGDFLHRVGNSGTVALDKLFKAKDGVTIGTTSVTVEAVNGSSASGTYSSNAIQFNGTGVVKVTIKDDDTYCIPTVLNLEVVDAVNATGATSATSNNVVLLNDCGLSSLTVSGRYTFYGNGFTMTYTGNGQYLNNGLKQGVVTVSENGVLDNVRIKSTIYPRSYLYYGSTMKGDYVQGGPSSVEGDKTRYHYQLSAVVAKGNATISNCYIYGGRNNIFVDTGDVTIKDTILESGTVANLQIQSNSSHTITLENVTTIQKQVHPTIDDTSKTILGAAIIVGPEMNTNPKIVLNGSFKQYNWVTAADKDAVSDELAKEIIGAAVGATDYNHTVNGQTSSNLGIVYMNNVERVLENNTGLPYVGQELSISGATGYVYSVKGATEGQIYSDVENADRTTTNGLYPPQFKYDSTLGGQYIANTDGCDEFLYREGDTIKVMFVSGATKEIDLSKLVNIAKYSGQNLDLNITCKDGKGNAVNVTNGNVTLSAADEYTVTYTVTDTVFYDKEGKTYEKSVEYSWNVTISASLKDKTIPNASFVFDKTKQIMGYGTRSGITYLGKSNYQYIPFLAGMQIYDYNGQDTYLRFDGNTDFGKIAGVALKCESDKANITVTLTDGGVINVQFFGRADSGSSTKTGTIQTYDNTVYYLTDGDTSATTTTWTIENYSFVGFNGVQIVDTKQVFSNCVKGTVPTDSFSTSTKYTVTYNANGGNCVQSIGYATSASASVSLPLATRFGYVFKGWYDAASGGTRVGGLGDSYTPSANITLYAQWAEPFDVTFNYGTGTVETQTYRGTPLALPNATNGDKVLKGWYDAASGGNRIGGAGDKYTPTAATTLYAQWQTVATVTYDATTNGGSCSTTSATFNGADLILPTPNSRTGYTFNGWYTAASGGTKIGDAGAKYTPEKDITLYAQWTINSYTIKVTSSGATVKVNGTTVNNNKEVSIQYGTQVTVEVSYSYSKNKTTSITGADGTTYGTSFTMPAQTITINASSSCVTGDTLVTLADGTQKRIDQVTYEDQLLVWNFYTGEYTVVPAALIQNHGYAWNNIIKLTFSDGTVTKAVNEHWYFDATLNEFVMIVPESAADYVGHEFVKEDGNGYTTVTLVDVEVSYEYIEAYSILTAYHYNFITDGIFSLTSPVIDTNFFMPFEVGEDMTFDADKMAEDIAEYGLYEYADFEGKIPYEVFEALNIKYLKVAVGKGLITYDQIIELLVSEGVI